ncbi:hypothetical protein WJX79_006244 [Trebouxia sp. C0005]
MASRFLAGVVSALRREFKEGLQKLTYRYHSSRPKAACMAAALQDVTLKRGTRIEDAEGFVVTLGYLENLTQKEYTVIEPTPPGGNVGLDVVGSKIDEMLQIMKTNKLLAHFHARLCAYGVPLDAKDGFEFLDVHSHSSKLSFACTTAASTLIFSGGTDAVIVPYGAIVWQLQTRVLFHWKRPAELQSVESVLVQAQLELIGSLFNSNHPALVVFTDGINFVLLQPWGRGINFWHTFVNKPGHIVADDAMRLIAHHLLNISSRDPLFHHQEVDLRNSELSKELEPLLAAKRELGQGEGLAQQLDVDKDLPAHERFEGTFATILAWRESNLSYFS